MLTLIAIVLVVLYLISITLMAIGLNKNNYLFNIGLLSMLLFIQSGIIVIILMVIGVLR